MDILTPEYIADALAAYRSGARPSGIMPHALAQMSAAQDAELAATIAALPGREAAALRDPYASRGLAATGRDGVPACLACHGAANQNPRIPRLDFQPADYLSAQLLLWRAGSRGGGPRHSLMTEAVQSLTDAEIEAPFDHFGAR